MQETSNYKLKMPDGTDYLDINVFNSNFDKIDNLISTLCVPYVVATGAANVYIATLNPAAIMYKDGMGICLKINIGNTGASTVNVNGLGAINILDKDGNALVSGALKANMPYTMRYNGSAFILQ